MFEPNFPDQQAIQSIVWTHGWILFQPFDQEDIRIDSLHFAVDPHATFTIHPCRFIRNNILVPLKALMDQFVREGFGGSFLIFFAPYKSPRHSSWKGRGYSNCGGLLGGQSISTGIYEPTTLPRYAISAPGWSEILRKTYRDVIN